MKGKTKIYPWLPWAIAFCVATILWPAISYLNFNIFSSHGALGPWGIAQGVDTVRAINEFGSGTFDMAPYWEARIRILAGLILIFILGPTLWIFSEIQNQEKEITDPEDRLKKGAAWYTGVILVLFALTYSISTTVMKGSFFTETWENAEESRNMDKIKAQLFTLASDAAEHYYLSFKDGKEGGFIDGGKDFSLQQLKSYSSETQNEYVLDPVQSDSVITIYGIGFTPGAKSDFENANGDTGKVQLAVEVRPESKLFEFTHKNTNTR